MKALLVYYSRTGVTKRVAEMIIKLVNCDSEEILDVRDRSGFFGYLRSGREAMKKSLPEIKKTTKNPADYDCIILGTPVWAGTMASPLRSFISKNKDKFKKIAFFTTQGGSGIQSTFKHLEELCEKKPITTLILRTKEVKKEDYSKKVKDFLTKIKK